MQADAKSGSGETSEARAVSGPFGSADDTLAATRGAAEGHVTGERRQAGEALERGAVVGRYVTLSRLGAGGMGVVYAAYDPELDRRVALKLLLPGREGSDGRSRLLREAQALAKLQHPNVVTIHDVGTHDERVWMAMEFVEGQTFGAWCAAKPRRWAEVLDVLVHAGRGVAAAHAAGLLHRDLKPDNVMVGTDGRVRVMDFGLARGRERSKTEQDGATRLEQAVDDGPPSESELGDPRLWLTQPGALMGTPAYMAPEQFRGGKLEPATDQFGFCATAWEALFRVRPFAGEGLVDRAAAVLEGKRAPVPRGTRVPGWLRRVLDRGLSVDPSARWPSMEVLLDALERGQTRARRRRATAGVAAVGAMTAGVLGWEWLDERRRIASCEAEGASIEQAWNDEARETLRASLVGTGMSHAETTAEKVMPWLDEHAQAWRTARTQACLDARVNGAWDMDLYARAQWCLDDRRMALEALVEELSRGETRAVDRAVQAAAGLDRLEPCLRRDALELTPAPPTEAREEVRAIWLERSKASALRSTGAYVEGLALAQAALERAEALDWPPLVAQMRLCVGDLLEGQGAYAEAEAQLEAAYFEAAQAGVTEAAASAADSLVYTVGYRLDRHADGLRWSRHAEVALASLPDPARIRLAHHFNQRAAVHSARGAYEEAKGLFERALTIREKGLGAEHPDVATSLSNLAAVHLATGAYEEAQGLLERALAVREKALGPGHLLVATGLNNLALVYWSRGKYEEAKRLYARALSIREQTLEPKHLDVATSLNNLANAHLATGECDEAKALHERVLAIREAALGSEHPDVATSLNNLALVHAEMGGHGEARTLHERALAIDEKVLGPEHPHVARDLVNLANVYAETGEHEEAKGLHERALAIREKALGPEHPDVASSLNDLAKVHRHMGGYEEGKGLHERALAIQREALPPDHPHMAPALIGLARIALAQRRPAEAVPLSQRAVEVLATAEAPATELAEARFVLALALSDAGRERARARTLAEQARDAWRNAGPSATTQLAEAEGWLQEHGGQGERAQP
jgi:eukaryotic-like serine/threonine-protein kinase